MNGNINNGSVGIKEHIQINVMRDILFKDFRQSTEKLQLMLAAQADEMHLIEKKISSQLVQLKQNFHETYSGTVNKIITQKLQNSQREVLDLLYPKLGELIQKYIAYQIDLLRTDIRNQIHQLFAIKSKPNWWQKLLGLKPALQTSELKEVFIVQKSSGLLPGQASVTETIKRELTAAMLTAVKGFMENAFLNDTDELEQVLYGYYTLLLFNFPTYYYVLAFSGNLTQTESHAYFLKACQFSQFNNVVFSENITEISQDKLSEKLKIAFITNSTLETEDSFLEPVDTHYHHD